MRGHLSALMALREIAAQKKTDELGPEREWADFEDGYDACIDTARAALAAVEAEAPQ